VEIKLKNVHYPVIMAATHVKELNTVETLESGMRFGASVTLSRLDRALRHAIAQLHGLRLYVISVRYTSVNCKV